MKHDNRCRLSQYKCDAIIPVTTLIIDILVKPVNGTPKKNENRYEAGNRLQKKQTITTITLPEKCKFSGCKILGFCSCAVVSLCSCGMWCHITGRVWRPPLCLKTLGTNCPVMWPHFLEKQRHQVQ